MSTKKKTADEFMPGRDVSRNLETLPEATEMTIQAFAASIWNDEEYRKSLRTRARSGDLTTAESRLLVEAMATVAPRKESAMSKWMKFTTAEELRTLVRISRLAIAREAGTPLPDDPARRDAVTNMVGMEIVTWR
jgi:hypothetical protein